MTKTKKRSMKYIVRNVFVESWIMVACLVWERGYQTSQHRERRIWSDFQSSREWKGTHPPNATFPPGNKALLKGF